VLHRPPDADFPALVAWLQARGGHVGPLVLAGEGAGRELYATEEIERGQLLLSVPLAACLGSDRARETSAGAAVHAGWRGPAPEGVGLAAAVAELRASDHPDWRPYLRMLPDRVEGRPVGLTGSDRHACEGTLVGALLGDIEARHHAEWSWLSTASGLDLEGDAASWSELRALVTSRQYQLHPYEGTALVPVADLFNHSRSPDVDWSFDRDLGRFEVRARRAASAGVPLRTSYGGKSNARLLVHYGFTLAENADDEVLLDLGQLGVVCLGFPRWGTDLAHLRRGLGIEGGTPAARRSGWRRLERALLARREALPSVPAAHPARVHLERVVRGERRVIDAWLTRCEKGLRQVVEPGAAPGRRTRLRPVPARQRSAT
jgi:hypothetical protein